jgi:hypothetical protein
MVAKKLNQVLVVHQVQVVTHENPFRVGRTPGAAAIRNGCGSFATAGFVEISIT